MVIDTRLLRKQITALEHLITDYPEEHILWGVINLLEEILDKEETN